MDVVYTNRVVARNSLGRFIADCEVAGERTMERAVQRGALLAKTFAPKGHRRDPRTRSLVSSIGSEMLSRTSGRWFANARHAAPQEFGAGPHEITGDVSFFWEKHWRMWHPGDNVINHPGNPAHPYMAPSYQAVSKEITGIAKSEYPG